MMVSIMLITHHKLLLHIIFVLLIILDILVDVWLLEHLVLIIIYLLNNLLAMRPLVVEFLPEVLLK